MARYSLFVLKVPLNPKQTNKQTNHQVLKAVVQSVVCVCCQTLVEDLIYFIVRYIPSMLVCVGCHAANLLSFCQHTTASLTASANVNITSSSSISAHNESDAVICHPAFGAV